MSTWLEIKDILTKPVILCGESEIVAEVSAIDPAHRMLVFPKKDGFLTGRGPGSSGVDFTVTESDGQFENNWMKKAAFKRIVTKQLKDQHTSGMPPRCCVLLGQFNVLNDIAWLFSSDCAPGSFPLIFTSERKVRESHRLIANIRDRLMQPLPPPPFDPFDL